MSEKSEKHMGAYQHIGFRGQQLAEEFLKNKGWVFKGRNIQTRWGEIDLLFEDQRTLVFVEVKTRQSELYGDPAEAITKTKQKHLLKAATQIIQIRCLTNQPFRFDAVLVVDKHIRHIEDAFWADQTPYYYS